MKRAGGCGCSSIRPGRVAVAGAPASKPRPARLPDGWQAAPPAGAWSAAGFAEVSSQAPLAGWTPPVDWEALLDDDGVHFLTPAGWWAALREAGTGTIFGVNSGKVLDSGDPDLFGAKESIFGSLATVGAAFLRQPGANVDLLWPIDPASPNSTLPVPVEDPEIYTTLYTAYFRPLVELLGTASNTGVPVVFTFLSYGTSGPLTSERDSAGPSGEGIFDVDFVAGSVPALDWSLHGDEALWGLPLVCNEVQGSLPRIARSGGELERSDDPRTSAFILSSLDVRSPYKRCYIGQIAREAAHLIADVCWAFSYSNDVQPSFAGVELFNEVNNACVTVGDPLAGARDWGDAVVQAVRGFAAGFEDRGLPRDFVGLWWPSLTSPNAEPGQAVQDVAAFHAALVAQVASQLSPADLALLVNQDAHWYRYQPRADRTPDVAPVLEIVDLVDALAANFAAAGVTSTVSICETGCSGTNPATSRPVGYVGSLYEFQRREVARRFSAAVVAGCSRVAWHSHMASTSSTFRGTGLRADDTLVDNKSDRAENAYPRDAYWVYQRLSALLGGWEDGAVGVLKLPASMPTGGYAQLRMDVAEEMLTVVEFQVPGGGEYVYLMQLDSTSEVTETDVSVMTSGGTVDADLVSLAPVTTTYTPATVEGRFPDNEEATFPVDVAVRFSTTPRVLTVWRDEDPILLRSPSPLLITHASATFASARFVSGTPYRYARARRRGATARGGGA